MDITVKVVTDVLNIRIPVLRTKLEEWKETLNQNASYAFKWLPVETVVRLEEYARLKATIELQLEAQTDDELLAMIRTYYKDQARIKALRVEESTSRVSNLIEDCRRLVLNEISAFLDGDYMVSL